MEKVELLAPAGSFEAMQAAIMSGADAVYLGGVKFGARAFASNFDNDQMIEAVNYAHLYGVRIYVTVNTLIYDNEVPSFLEYIDFLRKIGVDALIIQDIGMMHLLSKLYPDLELHASTQMHIHNVESLNNLKKLGVKRVVVPRETPISKVEMLKRESGMDIEVFVHGALCVSYSGQCLMSYLIGGRSGNRGECAGSCRLPYQLIEKYNGKEKVINTDGDYILSPKDLFTAKNIGKIIESGIDSLKIEGRMKRPEYVAVVTSLYRRAIDSYYEGVEYEISDKEVDELKKMFNRGFTKGYLLGDKGVALMNPKRPNHMGVTLGHVVDVDRKNINIKLIDDISVGDGVRIISKDDIGFTVSKMYKNNEVVKEAYAKDIITLSTEGIVNVGDLVVKTTDIKLINKIRDRYDASKRKISINATLTAFVGEPMILTIADGTNSVTIKSDVNVIEALKSPVTSNTISEKIKKIGDTPYTITRLDIKTSNNIFVPLTAINDIKRKALSKLSELRTKVVVGEPQKDYNMKILTKPATDVMIKAKVMTKEQYEACNNNGIDQIYIENKSLYDEVKDNQKVILSLPRVRKTKLKDIKHSLVGDLGSISENCVTDFSLNVVNSYAVAFLHMLGAKTATLSYELDEKGIKNLMNEYYNRYHFIPNVEVILYGRIEAMVSEYCPLNTYINKDSVCNICKTNKDYYLRDRFKNDYVLRFNNCLMTIYNYKKLNIIDKMRSLLEVGVCNFRLNFVDEDYEECVKIIKSLK